MLATVSAASSVTMDSVVTGMFAGVGVAAPMPSEGDAWALGAKGALGVPLDEADG